ncbi:MAG: hypothetical protein AAF497_17200 [Planctomycetota bacterium]
MDTTFLPALCCFGPTSATVLYFMLIGCKKIATPVTSAFSFAAGIGGLAATASYLFL